MAYDPCLTVADPAAPVHVTHHTHHAVHRVVGRFRHRIHHTQTATATKAAAVPSDACGKHLPSKTLAKLPVAAAPKAAVVGAASLLGAGVASTVGAHSFTPPVPPSGPGLPPPVIVVPPVVTPTPPVSVPEPSSVVLFLVAVTIAMIVRHRAQRNSI